MRNFTVVVQFGVFGYCHAHFMYIYVNVCIFNIVRACRSPKYDPNLQLYFKLDFTRAMISDRNRSDVAGSGAPLRDAPDLAT